MTDDRKHDSCAHVDGPTGGCEDGTERRTFLKEGLMALAALTALGATASHLHALTRSYATGRADGTMVRYPIPASDGVTIDSEHKVMLARYAGTIYAFGLECPHRGANVTWQAGQSRFYCPKHKSTFQPGGDFIAGKAERALDRYAIIREEDEIIVDTATLIRASAGATHAAARVTP